MAFREVALFEVSEVLQRAPGNGEALAGPRLAVMAAVSPSSMRLSSPGPWLATGAIHARLDRPGYGAGDALDRLGPELVEQDHAEPACWTRQDGLHELGR